MTRVYGSLILTKIGHLALFGILSLYLDRFLSHRDRVFPFVVNCINYYGSCILHRLLWIDYYGLCTYLYIFALLCLSCILDWLLWIDYRVLCIVYFGLIIADQLWIVSIDQLLWIVHFGSIFVDRFGSIIMDLGCGWIG